MKFKRKLLPIIVTFAIVCCLFGGIFGVDGAETQVARAEETISIYAETGESIAQGNTGYCYVYVDNTVDLASLTVAVHYDSQKMSVTGYYNQVSCSIYDASNNDGCLKFSYIFDAEGSETKTALFCFYYQINSYAEIGDTGFDVVVEEAYTTTLEVAPYSGSRCNFEIIEQEVVNECWIYGSYNISTSVKETFEIDYSLSNCYIASGSIDVKYDPELFEFVELTQGNFLNGKVVDVNASQRGTISLSFLATEYNYYSDLVKVKFRTLKNETTTSQIKLQVNDLYNLELSPFSCSGYTTDVNVTFDSTYAEDAPSVILGASILESTEQVLVTVLLEEGSRLGAGDFVLNFDTDDLEFVSYEKGFNPSFFNVNDKSVADGVLKFSVISMTDIVDEQTVLTILFNAKRECVNKTSNITISGTGLTDSLTNGILLNFVDTTANIPLKHTSSANVVENNVAPTCTAAGSYDNVVYCAICDTELSRVEVVVSALGHDLIPHDSKEPTCAEIGWSAYVTCSRCDYTTYQEISATGHTESAVVVENNDAPTCTATGSYDNVVYCATCDTELSRTTITVDALGHDPVEHSAKAPTCTEIGWNAHVTCSRCDHTTYAEIPATGHSHNAVVTAPTCTEEGYTTYTCHCGDTYVANRVAALGHTESGAVVENTVDPTCTTDGSYDTVVYCGVCFEELSRDNHSISKLGHVIVSHNAQAPTCTEIGWDKYETCSRCDHTTYTEIPAKGHTESSAVVENIVAPTCIVAGSYDNVVYCSTCDAELSRDEVVVPALGHDLIPHDSKAPTCTAIGWNTYVTCSRCDHTTYQEITATGHKDANNDKLCDVCDAPLCDAHTPSENLAFDEEGHWSVCSVCGYALEKVDHTYETATTAPTCLEQGYTTFTCHCGHSYKANFVDASGHTKAPSVIENKIEPTCVNNGGYEKVVYCSICGDEVSRERVTLHATGHDIVKHNSKAPTCTAIGWNEYETCSRCDYTTYTEIPATGHTPAKAVIENMVSATCLQAGEYDSVVYCATCGEEVSRQAKTILALGHYIIHNAGKEATCTEDGWDAYDMCARCDYSTYKVVSALGHDLIPHDSKAPTCTDIGWNTYVTCSRCDHTTYAEIPATGHSHNAVVTAPTCTEQGYTTHTCHCGDEYTDSYVDALGHDAIPHDSKAPTCTEIGWSAYVTCSRCDHTTYAEIPATGHSTTSHEAKEPTCTEIGWNAYVTCDKCDYTTYEELAKTPHIPSDAVRENVVESTTETEGHYDSVVYCSVCGHEISREQKTTPIISDANISDPNSGEKDLGVGEIAAIATTTSASATGGIAALVSFILKRRKIKIKK